MYPVAAMSLVLVGAGKDFWTGHMDHALGYDLCMQEIFYPRIPPPPLDSHSPDHCGVQLPSVEKDAVEGGSQAALAQHSKGGSDRGLI